MPSCVLRYCSNNWKNTNKAHHGITFHKFPQPGHDKRESWIKFVQKNRSEETWLPSQYSQICSVHFKTEHKYTTNTGRTYLKKSAVPCDNAIESDDLELQPLSEEVSSSESIFDSPKKILLKKKLRKVCAAKKNLAEKYKKIQRQNFYLKKKCACYKEIVQNLKGRFNLD